MLNWPVANSGAVGAATTMVRVISSAAVFLRWRPDKAPADCRYDQLEVTPPAELALVFRPVGG